MQCTRTPVRNACAAYNAFDIPCALRAAFGSTSTCLKQEAGPPQVVRLIDWKRPGRTERIHSKRDVARIPADELIKNILPTLQRHAHWQFTQGDFLGYEKWQRQVQMVRETAARLRQRDGSVAFNRASYGDQGNVQRALDYPPKIIEPKKSDADPPLLPPWAVPKYVRAAEKRGRRVLQMELQRFAEYMELSPMERIARRAVVEETISFIHEVFKGKYSVELFGSETTGLASPVSDIDIRFWDHSHTGRSQNALGTPMTALTQAMHDSGNFWLVYLRHGKHPIINCQHRESGIQIQIVGSKDAGRQHEAVAKYLEAIPTLRGTFAAVRTFFEMRGLSDTYSGGIGSYGQFIMLAAAAPRPRSDGPVPMNLADHFLRFLAFYDELDYLKRGVAIGKVFPKHDETPQLKSFAAAATRRGDLVRAGQWAICARSQFEPYLLCIQDPAAPKNDLGKRSTAIKHIVYTIKNLRFELRKALNREERFKEDESVLGPFVGRCHEVYAGRRQQMEEYGMKVAKEESEREQREKDDASDVRRRGEDMDKAEVAKDEFFKEMDASAEDGDQLPREGQRAPANAP